MHTNEWSISVILRPFDSMNVPFRAFARKISFQKYTPMLEYKPSEEDGGSYSLSPDIKYVFAVVVVSSRVSNLCGRTSQDMSCEIRSFLIPGTLRSSKTLQWL